jgi:hypothetical protein
VSIVIFVGQSSYSFEVMSTGTGDQCLEQAQAIMAQAIIAMMEQTPGHLTPEQAIPIQAMLTQSQEMLDQAQARLAPEHERRKGSKEEMKLQGKRLVKQSRGMEEIPRKIRDWREMYPVYQQIRPPSPAFSLNKERKHTAAKEDYEAMKKTRERIHTAGFIITAAEHTAFIKVTAKYWRLTDRRNNPQKIANRQRAFRIKAGQKKQARDGGGESTGAKKRQRTEPLDIVL